VSVFFSLTRRALHTAMKRTIEAVSDDGGRTEKRVEERLDRVSLKNDSKKLVLLPIHMSFPSCQLEKILEKVADDVQSLHADGATNSAVHWGVGISATITFVLLCLRLAGVPIPDKLERALEAARAMLGGERSHGTEAVGFAAAAAAGAGAERAAQSEFANRTRVCNLHEILILRTAPKRARPAGGRRRGLGRGVSPRRHLQHGGDLLGDEKIYIARQPF